MHSRSKGRQYCASGASQRIRWIMELCASAVSREAGARRSAAALAMTCQSSAASRRPLGCTQGRAHGCTIARVPLVRSLAETLAKGHFDISSCCGAPWAV